MYLAANISNPLVAPWLIFAEVQAGAWLRRGAFHPLTLRGRRADQRWAFGLDVLVGSVLVGARARGACGGRHLRRCAAPAGSRFADSCAARRIGTSAASITAWEFARGKLRDDPMYRAALSAGVLVSGGTLVDVGCGQGLMLALLAEAKRAMDAGTWPADWPPPPRFERMIGIELRRRVAQIARAALESDAEIIEADARTMTLEPFRAVLLFDVLQLIAPDDQEALLATMTARLSRAASCWCARPMRRPAGASISYASATD